MRKKAERHQGAADRMVKDIRRQTDIKRAFKTKSVCMRECTDHLTTRRKDQ